MKDLFESYEDLPISVLKILEKFETREQTYDTCGELVSELNKVGYTCEYYLDAVPFNLQKIEGFWIKKFVEKIDFNLLEKQKGELINLANNMNKYGLYEHQVQRLDGIIHLLDNLQDTICLEGYLDEEVVFNTK